MAGATAVSCSTSPYPLTNDSAKCGGVEGVRATDVALKHGERPMSRRAHDIVDGDFRLGGRRYEATAKRVA